MVPDGNHEGSRLGPSGGTEVRVLREFKTISRRVRRFVDAPGGTQTFGKNCPHQATSEDARHSGIARRMAQLLADRGRNRINPVFASTNPS